MEHDGNSKNSQVCVGAVENSQVHTIYPQDWIYLWGVLSAEFIIVTTEQVRLYML